MWKMAQLGTLCASVFCGGCATRTILIPPGEPVRIRQELKAVKVWVADKDGKEVEGVVDLPIGWYVLPDPGK